MATTSGRKSGSNETARREFQARLMKLTPIERMKRALAIGRTARKLSELGARSHGRGH